MQPTKVNGEWYGDYLVIMDGTTYNIYHEENSNLKLVKSGPERNLKDVRLVVVAWLKGHNAQYFKT
jgi:hypothetical protein